MNRQSFLASLAVLLGCGSAPVQEPVKPDADGPRKSEVVVTRTPDIEGIVKRHLAHSRAPGFAVGVIDGSGQSAYGFGRISKDAEGAPRGDTVYEIGSVTKVFTTFLL